MNRQQRLDALYTAGRYGLLRRLIDDRRISEQEAERWCLAWENEAERQAVDRDTLYWRLGSRWILGQVTEGRRPPSPPV